MTVPSVTTSLATRRDYIVQLGQWIAGIGALPVLPFSAYGAENADDAGAIAPNWYCVRRDGVPMRRGWTDEKDPNRIASEAGAGPSDSVEICVADAARSVSPDRFSRVFYNRARGLVGIELEYQGNRERYAPTRMISDNLSFDRVRERFLVEQGIERGDFDNGGRLWVFPAHQYLVGPGGGVRKLTRGSTLVPAEPGEAEDRPAALADGIGAWMLANLAADGALPYKYWPSRGAESPADNAIRRFLATIALARLGERRGSAAIRDAARRNLRYNLDRYFRPLGDGRGVIAEQNWAKLGAAGLAALAILESAHRQEFSTELDMLAQGVNSMFDEQSGFRTFFYPAERDGQNWNFYSGEALLFCAEAQRRRFPGALPLEKCLKVFEACRDRHRRQRNPAFVPWHTQACTALYAVAPARELVDWVFEMNDWLLPMQQWDGLDEDVRGRFYDPDRRHFGPPHASSTAVYCEGLADAAALAREVGDGARAEAYERAVRRGMRSLRQLQFRDARDAFYVSRRHRVMGGLRTTVYDNAVRVDSAGHALAAAIKVSHPIRFGG